MADDITLTVRVRDLTRGEFNRIRQRLNGMSGDIRRLGQANQTTGQQANRMGQEVQRLGNRLSHLQRTGRMAGEEMTHMRRTMSLLGRELRQAARAGDLTEDQFDSLSRQLERTRLDFDYLARDIDRHNTRANRAARDEQRRQAATHRMGQLQARAQRDDEARTQRMGRTHAQAMRDDARRDAVRRAQLQRMGQLQARALREEAQRVQRAGQLQARALGEDARRDAARQRRLQRMGQLQARVIREEAQRIQRMGQLQARALRDDETRSHRAGQLQARALREDEERTQRLGRLHAQALRMDRERDEAQRRAATQAQQRSVARLSGLGGDDQALTLRFRALGESDMNRMSRGFTNLQRTMAGISGSSAQARRSVRALGGDLRTMARALQDAQDAGSLSRREFDALSNGLRLTVRDARQLVISGDMTRASFRNTQREVAYLRAQLRLLGREGNVFQRLGDGALLLQRRLRDTHASAGIVRRSLSRMGEGGLGGLQVFARGMGMVTDGVSRFRDFVRSSSRGMKIFLAVLALIGPLAPAIGALLTTVLGGAFIALGAFALRSEKDIKSAFTHMKSTIGVSVRAAAQPLKASLIVAMHEVAEATQEMGGALTEAFAGAAPLVSNFAGAFTDLAGGALPGIVESLREMGPVMEGFRDAMGTIGEGLGQMFAVMTSGGGAEGLQETWGILGDGIRDVLVNIGEFINAMSQSETATTLLSTAFGVLSSILVIIEGVFAAVDTVLGPLIEKMGELGLTTGLVGALAWGFEQLGVSSVDAESSTSAFTDSLKGTAAAQNEAAVKTLSHAEALKQLNEQIKTHNSENLNRFEAEASMNQALIDAMKNVEDLGKAVKINNGIFDTTHENTNKVAQDFYKLAESTQRAVDAAVEADQPLKEQNRLWKEGEASIRSLGKAYGIPKAELDAFIALVLKTPKTAKTEMQLEAEEAKAKAVDLLSKIEKADGFQAKLKASLEAAAAIREAGRITALLNGLNGRVTSSKHIHTSITTEIMRKVEENASPTFTANGGVLRAFANGGKENHVAQIAPAGSWRVWAEDETGGESYIPLSPAKRARSRRIAEQTMGILGGRVEWFAKGGVKSEARQAIGPIKGATSGDTEKSLLRLMNSIIKGTVKLTSALKSVTSALDKAKSKLSELKSSASSLSSNVKSRTMTDITSGVDPGKAVTVSSVMRRMTVGRDKATAFANALKQLRKRGLNKGLLRQIAEAGVDGGGLETAGALLRASGSELKSINSLHSQMSGAASSAGKTTADAIYGAQIKSQEKLVKALGELEKALKNSVAKSKKKATGGVIGAATGGLRGGLVEVGERGPELVRLPFGSSVYSNADSRRIAGRGGGGSGDVYHLTLEVGGKAWEEVWIDTGRRAVRTRGGKVEAVLNSRK